MEKFIRAVDENRARILAAERFIWAHPETGYKEVKTFALLENSPDFDPRIT